MAKLSETKPWITDDELKLADFGSCRGIYSKQARARPRVRLHPSPRICGAAVAPAG